MSTLWDYVQGRQQLDPEELLSAVEQESVQSSLDWRTRRLIHECRAALARRRVKHPRFPSLPGRIQSVTKRETILEYLRELGQKTTSPCKIIVGGSSALILLQLLSRSTEDIDLVNEVPEPLRSLRSETSKLQQRYGLLLTHFQSHYLPEGWEGRLSSLGRFARLEVWLVDATDIFIGKVFSRRDKDLDDLRALKAHLGYQTIRDRLSSATKLSGEADTREAAQRNWYILFGEDLPDLGF